MATILEFRPTGRSQLPPALKSGRGGVSAEIVFFPGVRYERWQKETPSKSRRKTKKRDKIEVNER
jgi:hypothetical protein